MFICRLWLLSYLSCLFPLKCNSSIEYMYILHFFHKNVSYLPWNWHIKPCLRNNLHKCQKSTDDFVRNNWFIRSTWKMTEVKSVHWEMWRLWSKWKWYYCFNSNCCFAFQDDPSNIETRSLSYDKYVVKLKNMVVLFNSRLVTISFYYCRRM